MDMYFIEKFAIVGLVLAVAPLVLSILDVVVRKVLYIMLACDDEKAPKLFRKPWIYLSVDKEYTGPSHVEFENGMYCRMGEYGVYRLCSSRGNLLESESLMFNFLMKLKEHGLYEEFVSKVGEHLKREEVPYISHLDGWLYSALFWGGVCALGVLVDFAVYAPVLCTVVACTAGVVFGTRALAKVVWNHEGRITGIENGGKNESSNSD